MNSLNSILLEGNLTEDPKLTTTKNNISVCNFSIVSNNYYRISAEESIHEVSYFDITAWKGLANTCFQYLKKGRGVRVVGSLKQDKWTDLLGNNQSKITIRAEHVEFKPDLIKKS